ncbi:MAG: ATP-dependent helicase [Coriobacteriia bacterium]|nr:ATP-dependent helicase [Coriobacteriia bacterium]
MPWHDDLTPEQRTAAEHIGTHARLLAGPGTGKTRCMTKRICFLIEERNVEPCQICALTFTRAAAQELRRRVESEVGPERIPSISTLHSFALRQLLRNSDRLTSLPQPLRIADDWEERHIILEDLKVLLRLNRIDEARRLLNELSADWQRLTADEADWDSRFPNPAFLGAWSEHRGIYGYVLRAELVYQLKRALEQHRDFRLDGPPAHLLVDEYQDLNRCELAVVKAIGDRGAEVYAAGDDDQSIYGFRMAHPEGIRRFPQDYQSAHELTLEVCKRCDQEILDLGLFVARQDFRRIEKSLRAEHGRTGAEIGILRFRNQKEEVQGVAALCRHLICDRGLQPDQILILLRSDRKGAFSSLLRQALDAQRVPVGIATADTNPLNAPAGRLVLAFLRLLDNNNDHLAWRTLLSLRNNNLGRRAVDAVYEFARKQNAGFAAALEMICDDPALDRRHGGKIKRDVEAIRAILQELSRFLPAEHENEEARTLTKPIEQIVRHLVDDEAERHAVEQQLQRAIQATEPESKSISDLLRALEVSREDIEQEIDQGKVNILTMHKAKGLTAEAVIILAAEDEYLPGRAEGEAVDDERRLLYVSLTRARRHLLITYCEQRTGVQRHSGRTSGQQPRSLTRFLCNGPIVPQLGPAYVASLGRARS